MSWEEADEEADEGEVGFFFEEIERATIHADAEKDLRGCLTDVEAHIGMMISVVPLVVVEYLGDPESSWGKDQNSSVVEEEILVYEK